MYQLHKSRIKSVLVKAVTARWGGRPHRHIPRFTRAVARPHSPARSALANQPAWAGGRAGLAACPKVKAISLLKSSPKPPKKPATFSILQVPPSVAPLRNPYSLLHYAPDLILTSLTLNCGLPPTLQRNSRSPPRVHKSHIKRRFLLRNLRLTQPPTNRGSGSGVRHPLTSARAIQSPSFPKRKIPHIRFRLLLMSGARGSQAVS